MFSATYLAACTGSVGPTPQGSSGVAPDDPPGVMSPGTGGAVGVPRPPSPTSFAFGCQDPRAGEPRRLRRLSKPELRAHVVNALSGLSSTLGSVLDPLLSGLPDDTGDDEHFAEERLEVSDGHLQTLLSLAEGLGAGVAALPPRDLDLLGGAACQAPATKPDECARGLANELGLRLLRRPLTPADITGLRAHLGAAAVTTPAQAVGAGFTYLLLQPASLMHVEDGGEPAGAALKLTAFEAMNRIHFGLLGTPPPVALLKQMREPGWSRARAEAKIDEILASAAFKARLLQFFRGWLGFGPDVDLTGLPAAMTGGLQARDLPDEAYNELRAFLSHVVFDAKGSVADLFLSPKVHHLGPNLAKVYGLTAPASGALDPPMALDPEKHVGLLSRAAMNLHVTAQTSPISRGVRVKRKVLCEDIHPPANVNLDGGEAMPIDDPNKYSNRFLVENKTSPPFCRACHVSIDSIGFSLDFYDSLGRFRAEEVRYDAKGAAVATFPLSTKIDLQVLPGRVLEDAGGPVALAREIVATETGSACFVSQWLTFSTQRDRHDTQSCLKQALHRHVAAGGAGILEMIRQSARAELDGLKSLGGMP